MDKYYYILTFDLSKEMLERYYPKYYTSSYKEINRFMQDNNFSARQGSLFISNEPITQLDFRDIIIEMHSKFEWLLLCEKENDAYAIPESKISQISIKDFILQSKSDEELLNLQEKLAKNKEQIQENRSLKTNNKSKIISNDDKSLAKIISKSVDLPLSELSEKIEDFIVNDYVLFQVQYKDILNNIMFEEDFSPDDVVKIYVDYQEKSMQFYKMDITGNTSPIKEPNISNDTKQLLFSKAKQIRKIYEELQEELEYLD